MVPTKKLKAHSVSITLPKSSKPRARELNDTLLSRPAGRMKDPRDRIRSREKQEARGIITEDLSN